MNYSQEVLDSTRYVVDHSENVRINKDRISEFCQHFSMAGQTNWLEKCPVNISHLTDKEKTHLLLTFNSLSFSYWGEPSWTVTYEGMAHNRGSWSMIAALMRARDEGIDILDPKIQSRITIDDLEGILRGNTRIPLLEERVAILNEVGTALKEYNNDFQNLIYESKNDAIRLLEKIVDNFSLFGDRAVYNEKKVCFYKRAQALVQSIDSITPLTNAKGLTALADYMLPVPLRSKGILEYSDKLAQAIDNRMPIKAGGKYETEIRANTVWAFENIREALQDIGTVARSKEINDYFWLIAGNCNGEHHRTRTTAY